MRTTNKGWDSCGNAPARVDETWQILLACAVTDASNDPQPAEPLAQATLATLSQAGMERPRDDTGAAQALAATVERGYDREAAVAALETMGCDPYMATGRQCLRSQPQRQRAWQQRCGRLQARRCTPDAR